MQRVLVVGESLIDVVRRHGEPPAEHVGGSPANVALGLGRLGRNVRLRTALARDERGERIAETIRRSGAEIDEASWLLDRTATAAADIGADGSASYGFDIEWRLDGVPSARGAAVVHVGSIAAYLEPGASDVLRLVESAPAGRLVSFDPNVRPALVGSRDRAVIRVERIAARAHVVKLSDEDAQWLYPGVAVADVAELLLRCGARLVAVTRGAEGTQLRTAGESVHVPAPAVEVRDTVGAGDSFMAGVIDALLDERDTAVLDAAALERIGRRAALIASITVQREGADLPTRAEVDAAAGA